MPRATEAQPTSELVTARKFGVELELTGLAIDAFLSDCQRYGVNVVREYNGGSTRRTPTSWILKRDGSVHGLGLELVSPPMQGVKGLAEVRFVLELVKANGGTVDVSCGLHVHHSAHDLEAAHLRNLLVMFWKYQDMLYLVADPARAANHYCRKLSDAEFNAWLASQDIGTSLRNMDRYRGINFASLNVHRTVELRLLEGTTNAAKVIAWVSLTQRLVRVARWASAPMEANKVGAQFQLLGAVTKMLSRNGNTVSEEEEQAFNLLSGYYHKHARMTGQSPRRRAALGV